MWRGALALYARATRTLPDEVLGRIRTTGSMQGMFSDVQLTEMQGISRPLGFRFQGLGSRGLEVVCLA